MTKTSKYFKPITQLSLFAVVFSILSCRTYYGNGLAGGIYTNMQTPMAEDENAVSKNYIDGKYNCDVNYYEQETNESAELSYHYAVSEKHITYAFGVFGFLGNYQIKNLPQKFEDLNGAHNYYGGGFRSKVAYNVPLNSRVHWRVIGLQSSWNFEKGDYNRFKDKLRQLENIENGEVINSSINTTRNFSNLCFYPFSEFAIKIGDSWQVNPQFGFGFKINEIMAIRGFTSLNISYKNVHIWSAIQNVGISIDRVLLSDFSSRQMGDNNHFQLGMAFSF